MEGKEKIQTQKAQQHALILEHRTGARQPTASWRPAEAKRKQRRTQETTSKRVLAMFHPSKSELTVFRPETHKTLGESYIRHRAAARTA